MQTHIIMKINLGLDASYSRKTMKHEEIILIVYRRSVEEFDELERRI